MLLELRARDLGVIDDLTLLLRPGMTAVTGETGAGKTLLVEALELLVGGRAGPHLVRAGAEEASVEGRFVVDDAEVVVARAIPADGRSRAYLNGRMVPASALAEITDGLVDLHGQHAHQSLLSTATQRQSLDSYAGVDLGPLSDARRRLADIDRSLAELGGDARARARESDLLRYQVDEVDAASLADAEEDDRLRREEDLLGDAQAHRDAAAFGVSALSSDGGAVDRIGEALSAVAAATASGGPFGAAVERLRLLQQEAAAVAEELRQAAEAIADDPERLEQVRARRLLLQALRKKYGETLAEVIEFRDQAAARLEELESHDRRAAELEAARDATTQAVAAAAARVARARRLAAPKLATAIEERLRTLAMPHARFAIDVTGDDPGDHVTFLLSANPDAPPMPLARVASGGELARAMLAARLVLSGAPPVLVFDEVDAGIGGEAAVAVGRALADLAVHSQVLVVTHLPQVAAFADNHVAVAKTVERGTTRASATALDDTGRVVELSRMLSGLPDSDTARGHARELLAVAAEARSNGRP